MDVVDLFQLTVEADPDLILLAGAESRLFDRAATSLLYALIAEKIDTRSRLEVDLESGLAQNDTRAIMVFDLSVS